MTAATISSMAKISRDGAAHLALVQLTKAQQALVRAKDPYEIKKIIDVAEDAQVTACAAKLSEAMAHHAEEIKLLAQRKTGEFLAKLERRPGARADLTSRQPVGRSSEYRLAIRDAEIEERAAQRYQQIAAVPEPQFNRYLENREREISTAGLLPEMRAAEKEIHRESVAAVSGDTPSQRRK
jgi:hypothetical protein